MKKLMIVAMMCCLMLGGCGRQDIPSESKAEESSAEQEKESENETKEPEYIDGFEVAEYDKYNSYASENGLGGTLICVEGKVISQANIQDSDIPILAIVVEQEDGKRWSISLTSDSKISEIGEKNVRVFGTYQGFSDLMSLPGISVSVNDEKIIDKARIEVDENGNWVEAWNFYNNYAKAEIDKLNNPEDSSEEESVESESEEGANEGSTKESESTSTVTAGQRNALKSAKDYLSFTTFSYEGLVDQLEYEKYSHEDAVYAADNCGADWNEQALKSAKNYLSFTAFSYKGLIEQLEYEQFTKEQATYGADNCGADWNEQAAKSAENYLSMMSFSKDGLIEQLEYEGFTHEQAVYGAEQNGY